MQSFPVEASDGTRLTAYEWRPAGPPRAVVQLAHGAAEHLKRYDRLARALNAAGYAVTGADHRGHGANAGVHGLGDFGPRGFAGVVDDMATVAEAARRRWPGLPLVLFGHSLGSFAAQGFLMAHGSELAAFVLSGTAAVDELLRNGPPTGGLRAFNAAFEPSRTEFDWLSRDEAEVDAYIADPLCGFDIAPQSMATVAAETIGPADGPRIASALAKPPPVYVISGESDPIVGRGQVYTNTLVDRLRAGGLTDVTHRVYPEGRHEMLNETNRGEVTADLLQWLASHV